MSYEDFKVGSKVARHSNHDTVSFITGIIITIFSYGEIPSTSIKWDDIKCTADEECNFIRNLFLLKD